MCESLASARWRRNEQLKRHKQKFSDLKLELHQMEPQIKDAHNIPQLRKRIQHFCVLLEDMEANSIKFVKEKTK